MNQNASDIQIKELNAERKKTTDLMDGVNRNHVGAAYTLKNLECKVFEIDQKIQEIERNNSKRTGDPRLQCDFSLPLSKL